MATTNRINIKTETERLLFQYYTEEKSAREELETLVNDLKSQINELQNQLQHVQKLNITVSANKEPSTTEKPTEAVQYETDEEELAKETEWVRQKNRKKRKLNLTPSPPPAQGVRSKEKSNAKKPPLPPPIVVENVSNYQQFYDLLSATISNDMFIVKTMNGQNVKINAKDEESYRSITKILAQNNCLWYSYENKQDRPIRVIAKNLHSSCLPNRIIEDLQTKGYKIQDAVNKLSWRTKEPLNIFTLSFAKDESIDKIYNIKSILSCKVEIEPLKTSQLIPQCKRCQAYGHTQKYCSREPKCVKCTGKHLTKDCQKPRDAKPKCVHCGEPHPSNYRGCIVAKELQKIKNKSLKKNVPTTAQASNNKIPKRTNFDKLVTKNVSFADIAKGAQPRPQPQTQQSVSSNNNDKINKILSLLTSFDERLKKLENTYSK